MARTKKMPPEENIIKDKKDEITPPPKKRGRPKKIQTETTVTTPKKRGRPRKTTTEEVFIAPKKRGRPRKNPIEEPKVPKKRGRPRKVQPEPIIEQPKEETPKYIDMDITVELEDVVSEIQKQEEIEQKPKPKKHTLKKVLHTIKKLLYWLWLGIKYTSIYLFKAFKYLLIYIYLAIKFLLLKVLLPTIKFIGRSIKRLYYEVIIPTIKIIKKGIILLFTRIIIPFLKLVSIGIKKLVLNIIIPRIKYFCLGVYYVFVNTGIFLKEIFFPTIWHLLIKLYIYIFQFIKTIINVIIFIITTTITSICKVALIIRKSIKNAYIKLYNSHRSNQLLRKQRREDRLDEKIEAGILKEKRKQAKLEEIAKAKEKKEKPSKQPKQKPEIKGKLVIEARPLINPRTGKPRRIPDDDLILLRYRDQKGLFRKIFAFFRNRIKVVKFDMMRFRKRLKYGTFLDKLLVLIMIMLIGGFGGIVAFCIYIVRTAPEVTESNFYSSNSTILYDAKGNELVRLGAEAREKITYDDLPEVLIDAIVATEDSRFFQHNGVDLARFTKAAIGQVMGRDDAGGGSTLTMQLSKNFATSKEAHGIQGIIRKFTDVYLSVFVLEKRYTKEQIMEFYVNMPFLGSNSYGVEQACQTYFGKSVTELSLPEAALIAGLFQAPSNYNPYSFPQNAEKRRNTVLNLMQRHGYITEEQNKEAQSVPVTSLLSEKNYGISIYQGFIDTVTEESVSKYGYDPYNTSMLIYTTLDTSKQDVINKLYDTYKWKNPQYTQAGIAVVNVSDGAIVAVGAGRNKTSERSFNLATSARRQPGSVAKPVLDYGPAIEYLGWGTGTTVIDDTYGYTVGGNIKNYDNKFKGILTAKKALAGSRNIPALYAFQQTTNQQKRTFAESLGWYHIPDDGNGNYLESTSIGGFEGITPVEAAGAYSTFARGGTYIEPYTITKIVLQDTEETIVAQPKKIQAMSEETAFIINMILKYAVTSGTINPGKVSGTDLAAKTGTTTIDAKRKAQLSKTAIGDSWQVTYSPDYVIALWYGYETNTKEHHLIQKESTQNRRAISQQLVAGIMKKNSTFRRPSGIVTVDIELETDPVQLASEFTPTNLRSKEYFKKENAPSDVSNRFEKLSDPSSVTYTSTETSVTLNWTAAKTPQAIQTDYLLDYFNNSNLYKHWAQKYYNNRIKYNKEKLGDFGYRIYMKTDTGTKELGFTTNTTFTANVQFTEKTQFIVKTSYKLFTANASPGYYLNVEPNSTNITDPSLDPNNTTKKTTKEVTKILTIDYLFDGESSCTTHAHFTDELGANPKNKVVVMADGVDVTEKATVSCTAYDKANPEADGISCNELDRSKEYNVFFNAKYNGQNVSLKVNVAPTC